MFRDKAAQVLCLVVQIAVCDNGVDLAILDNDVRAEGVYLAHERACIVAAPDVGVSNVQVLDSCGGERIQIADRGE